MRVGVQKKDKFFIQQKKREPMKGKVLSQPLLSFLSNISSSTFCTVCDHFKSYFLPETELKGETVWCWYVERNSQRAAKLGRFWEKVTLVKAQSLKLNSAAAPLLFFSFRQPPKTITGTELMRENMSWKEIIKPTTLFWSFSKCICCYYSKKVAAAVRNYINRVW